VSRSRRRTGVPSGSPGHGALRRREMWGACGMARRAGHWQQAGRRAGQAAPPPPGAERVRANANPSPARRRTSSGPDE
jgi:hypothetical protein